MYEEAIRPGCGCRAAERHATLTKAGQPANCQDLVDQLALCSAIIPAIAGAVHVVNVQLSTVGPRTWLH